MGGARPEADLAAPAVLLCYAVRFVTDHEAMQVDILPSHGGGPDHRMQTGTPRLSRNEDTTPKRRADASQPNTKLVSGTVARAIHAQMSLPPAGSHGICPAAAPVLARSRQSAPGGSPARLPGVRRPRCAVP